VIDSSTGDRTGRGAKTTLDFDLLRKPRIIYFPILPFTPGIKNVLIMTKLGCSPLKWYSQLGKDAVENSLKYEMLFMDLIIWKDLTNSVYNNKLPE
jgi:hypothetical protein